MIIISDLITDFYERIDDYIIGTAAQNENGTECDIWREVIRMELDDFDTFCPTAVYDKAGAKRGGEALQNGVFDILSSSVD